MNIFETLHVDKKYSDKYALKNVSISIPDKSIFGLLGPNGAGKTTLLRIINHLTLIDKGEIFFKGRKMTSTDYLSIGYLPEERGLYTKMKVGEQLLYLAQLKGLSKNDALSRLKYLLEKFDILQLCGKKIDQLSKGIQQKVQFVNTIIHEPELLIFDEPFSGLDPINASIFKQEIIELRNKGKSIVLSTHDMNSVEEMCDDICLLNNGETILNGNLGKIKEKYKSNIFNITIKESIENDIDFLDDLKILETVKKNDIVKFKVQSKSQLENDVLLKKFVNKYKVISFTEDLPSMKEIFIKSLTAKNPILE